MNVAELSKGSQLDGGLHVTFKQHRQNHNAHRSGAAQTGVDPDITARHVLNEDALLLSGALADQALSDLELFGDAVAIVDGIAGQELQFSGLFFPRLRNIECPVLGAHEWRQLGEQKLRHGKQVALTLHHSGELRDVGFQPVLFVVLTRGGRKIHDHLIDVVLQRGYLALRLNRDGSCQIAFGNGGGHFGDRADLSGQVRRELVHVVRKIAPDAGRSRNAGLSA